MTKPDEGRQETAHSHPNFLPDGRHFLYRVRSARPDVHGSIYVASLDSDETQLLLQSDAGAIYSPPGYVLFLRGESLSAQPFDAKRLELSGEPFSIGELAQFDPNVDTPIFSVSATGMLVYRSVRLNLQLAWMGRDGKQMGTIGPVGEYRNIALSPDEKQVMVDRYDARTRGRDLWLYDLDRGTASRFTFDPSDDSDTFWSPDGKEVVFGSNRGGSGGLYRKASSGAGQEEMLVKMPGPNAYPRDWSSDGRYILFGTLGGSSDLFVLPLFGDRTPVPYAQTDFIEAEGRFSPNMHWIAYQSDESGVQQVYVQSFPISAGKWQISTQGGGNPKWRRDGKELYYLAADGQMMAVPVNTESPSFQAGAAKPLFPTSFGVGIGGGWEHYSVSADGQRFLLNVSTTNAFESPITVLVNWTAGLKK